MTILEKVKTSLRITTTAFDNEITDLIEASMIDLCIAGVDIEHVESTNPIILLAITTYCKVHFGSTDDYDRLKASYDEQKAQLSMSTGYTIW